MIVLGRLLLSMLLLVVLAPSADAATERNLTLVVDVTGSVEFDLPTFSIENAALTAPVTGIAGLVLERLGEPYTSTGNRLLAEAVRLDKEHTFPDLINFHVDKNGDTLPFAAGRYRLSSTATRGASATLTLGVTGLKGNVTLRTVKRPRLATGGVQRLDSNGVTGTFEGGQQLTHGTVKRAFALVSIGEETSTAGGFVGQNQICLVRVEEDCGAPVGFTTQFVGASSFGNYITGVYGPPDVASGQLFGHQRVTGISTPSRAWGWSVMIDAGP